MTRGALFLCCFLLLTASSVARGERFDFDGLLEGAVAAYAKIDDYVCYFHKKELLEGRVVEEVTLLKFKKPASYYMKWIDSGAEAIYVKGRNDDQLLYHAGGLLNIFAVSIDPRGPLAMRGNRHAITDAGLGHLLDLVEENYRKAKKDPLSRITYEGEASEEGRPVVRVRAEFPTRDYYSHVIRLQFDRATGLPLWYRVEGWEGEFLEEYRFGDLRLNVGLTDRDFDAHNSEYGFRWVLP